MSLLLHNDVKRLPTHPENVFFTSWRHKVADFLWKPLGLDFFQLFSNFPFDFPGNGKFEKKVGKNPTLVDSIRNPSYQKVPLKIYKF